MSPPVRIALLGFTAFERDQLCACLTPRPGDAVVYTVATDLPSCSLALANADDDEAITALQAQRRMGSTVVLGTTARADAAAQLGRPIHAAALRRALDALALVSPPMSDAVRRVQEELARLGRSRFAPARPPAAPRASAPMPLIEGVQRRPVALVVDEDDLLLDQLAALLSGHGLEWQRARSAADALERLPRDRPLWVFLPTGRDSFDSFHTCRLLRYGAAVGERPPQTVLLLENDNAVNRLRAQLARADAVLALPPQTAALEQLLSGAFLPAQAGMA